MRAPLALPVGGIQIEQFAASARTVFNEERHTTLRGETHEATTRTGAGSRICRFEVFQALGDQNLAFLRSQERSSSLAYSFHRPLLIRVCQLHRVIQDCQSRRVGLHVGASFL